MLLYFVAVCYALMRAVLTVGALRRTSSTSDQPFVSIVVAARNEADQLGALLSQLLRQDYPAYEVIIVDDRSTDATPDVLQAWRARDDRLKFVQITAAPQGRPPKMYALEQGVGAARGALLLFTDADCVVPPTWITAMARCFTPDVGAVIGYIELRAEHDTLLEHVQALDYFGMMALTASGTKLGHPLGGGGANLAYRRSAYRESGGFAHMPDGAIADDMLLIQRVQDRTRWRIAFCDDPRGFISTAAEPTLKQLLRQRARWMAGGQEVLRDNTALLVISSLLGTFNGMLLSFPLLLKRPVTRRALLWAIVIRVLADTLHLGVIAARWRRLQILRYLPLWLVAQVPYTIALPLYSLLGRWTWKSEAPGRTPGNTSPG